MKLSFTEAYKRWRNKVRRYSLSSIVDRALDVLLTPNFDPVEEMRKVPWLTLLALKWASQDRMVGRDSGKAITASEFDDLRQALWDFPESIELGVSEDRPLYLFLRQLLRPQVDFQRRLSPGFLREAALLASQPNNSRLRGIFEARSGLTVEDFIDLSYAMYSPILKGKATVALGWFDPLRRRYGDAVDAFIGFVSRDVHELVEFFRELPSANEHRASELFEFPVVRRYPFLRDRSQLVCWHRAVFFRGMEGMVHSVMSEAGELYMTAFSKLFEKHVISESRLVPGSTFMSEDDLKAYVPRDTKVTDGLISFPQGNVFVESKAGIFDESVMVAGHAAVFKSQTHSLLNAIKQAQACSAGLQSLGSAPQQILRAPKEYLIVVTNKELGVSRGDRLAAMYPDGVAVDPDSRLPLSHVYFMSIEDFERLVHGMMDNGMDLPAFLDECIERDSRPETALMFFEQHLDKTEFGAAHSEIVDLALRNAEARLELALRPTAQE